MSALQRPESVLEKRKRLPEDQNTRPSANQQADTLVECDVVDGVGVPQNNEMAGYTNYLNDACDQVSIRSDHYSRPTEMYTDVSNVTKISDYFARPIVWQSGVWAAASAPVFRILLDNTTIQGKLYNFSRVKGAYGWRGTLVFRLQIVATPFMAGLCRMAFNPFGKTYDRGNHISGVSQLPGVELDITDQTSCVLRIPFIHEKNFFTVASLVPGAMETLGYLVGYPLTGPTLAAGVAPPNYTLWFSLEDLELVGVAPAEYVGQSGMPSKKSASAREEMAVPGNFSNVLAAGSNLMAFAGSKIPFLSSISGQAAWALRQAANLAASFGWSRPIVVKTVGKVIRTNNVYQNNSDGPDTSWNMGLFSDNSVSCMPGFAGSNIDEMAFDYIKATYAIINKSSLTTTDARGAYKLIVDLCPYALFFQAAGKNVKIGDAGVNPGLAIYPSPLFALANCFRYWRGGLRFRIKMAKTKFHTGRVVVGYALRNPAAISTQLFVPQDFSNLQYPSVVWDLREGNSIEFDVPFISPLSYHDVTQSIGTLFMAVLEPLAGPSTVATTAPFVVEVMGLPDFELSMPKEILLPPAPVDSNYFAQSGLSVNEVPECLTSSLCIGEHIRSAKQMVARATTYSVVPNTGLTTVNPNNDNPTWLPNKTAPTSLLDARYDYFSYFRNFFGLERGGYCCHVIPMDTSIYTAAFLPGSDFITSAGFVSETDAPLHVKVPFYSKTSRQIIGPTFDTSIQHRGSCRISVSKSATQPDAKTFIRVRAADDYQLGYFVGAFPIAIPFTLDGTPGRALFQAIVGQH